MAVGQRRIREWPEVFSRLQLRRIGWEQQQVNVVWHPEALGAVPTGPIQHQHDLPGRACANLSRKGGEFGREEGNAD